MPKIVDLPLAKITRNENQPREIFPDEHIKGLAASIQRRGLIQPITVRPVPGGAFQIVAGECRYRAHQLLGAPTIRCIVEAMDDTEMQLRAIVENLQRRDMNPIEEARAFRTLLDQGYTAERIVEELGLKSTSIVRHRLELLNLTTEVQHLVASGQLPVTMAYGIALAEPEHQPRLLREVAAGRLRTSEQVKHAGIALRDAAAQLDAFSGLPKASSADLAALSTLERRVESVAQMVASGFREGECVAAQRVAPDRVEIMIEKLALIRKHVLAMEHDLRRVATQGKLLLGEAA